MLRLRVEVLDRPGSLAGVTRAVAACGADLVHLAVMQRGDHVAVDDLWLTLTAEPLVDLLVEQLQAVPGVRVLGWRAGAVPVEFDAQLDFLAYLFAAPQRGVEAFVEMLPAVSDADWATLRDDVTGQQVYSSHGEATPDADRDDILALSVSGGMTLLIGRDRCLAWHDAEIRRVVSVLELSSLLIAHTTVAVSKTTLTNRFVMGYGRVAV
jgi:hypothetical protein